VYDHDEHCHKRYLRATRYISFTTPSSMGEPGQQWRITFSEGELVLMGMSYKYSHEQTSSLFTKAKLKVIQEWTDQEGIYSVILLQKPQ